MSLPRDYTAPFDNELEDLEPRGYCPRCGLTYPDEPVAEPIAA